MGARSGSSASLQKSSCMQALPICATTEVALRQRQREASCTPAAHVHVAAHLGQRHFALAVAAAGLCVELVGAGGKVDQLR
jgi:hypothetical protein